MTDLDTLLREFRADAPDPAPGAEARIAARLKPDRSRRSLPIRLRFTFPRLAAVTVAAASICTAVALMPGERDQGALSGPASLLAKAEAAVSSHRDILELTISIHRTTTDPTVVPEDRDDTVTMREWSLPGAGKAMQTRSLISERPLDQAPTDEDTTGLIARDGSVADSRSWTPTSLDGARGELSVASAAARRAQTKWMRKLGGGDTLLASQLRAAYRDGLLRPAGRTSDGALRLRGGFVLSGTSRCTKTEVLLDRRSFIPSRIEISSSAEPAGARNEKPRCDAGAPEQSHETWTIESRVMPATAANRRVLQIGDWPTTRVVLVDADHNKLRTLRRAPAVPQLDQN